jgi:hypothetical protein
MAKQTFTTGQVLTADNMTSLQQTAMGGGSATAKTASYTLVTADAGSTVIMNSGSATTITVDTALFAAGDTVFIVNQGAGVCTITAGTATVSSAGSLAMGENETGQLYFLSTSAAIFSEYTQSAGAAPGLILITTQAISGVTSQSINNCFSATYQNYQIVFSGYCATSSGNPTFKLRVSGTDSTASYYSAYNSTNYNDGTSNVDYTNNGGSWSQRPLGTLDSSSTSLSGTTMTIYSPFAATNTAYTSPYVDARIGTNNGAGAAGGVHAVATSYDGFTITNATAMTGTVRVYGLAN